MYRSEEFDAIPITSSLRLDLVVSSYLDVVASSYLECDRPSSASKWLTTTSSMCAHSMASLPVLALAGTGNVASSKYSDEQSSISLSTVTYRHAVLDSAHG